MRHRRGTARASRLQTYGYYIRMCLEVRNITYVFVDALVHIIVVEFAWKLGSSFRPTFWSVVFKTWRWSFRQRPGVGVVWDSRGLSEIVMVNEMTTGSWCIDGWRCCCRRSSRLLPVVGCPFLMHRRGETIPETSRLLAWRDCHRLRCLFLLWKWVERWRSS